MARDQFRLELNIATWKKNITYNDAILLIGSCFTENMFHKLQANKFNVQQNPHGILFNPISIAQAINDYITNKHYHCSDLVHINGQWYSWHHHSLYSAKVATNVCQNINTAIANTHHFLGAAQWCIVTLGSAFVYEFINNNNDYTPVANCHKAPSTWFRRRLLAYNEVKTSLDTIIHSLQNFNPALQILFTVSPVRHLREGFIDNNRSKATLLMAVHDALAQYEHVHYFPSYELIIDDLRDYRFYADDMVHPNYTATNYVWQKFADICLDKNTRALMKEVEKVVNAYKHQALNPDSEAHHCFLAENLQKVLHLQNKLPFLNWTEEIKHFKK